MLKKVYTFHHLHDNHQFSALVEVKNMGSSDVVRLAMPVDDSNFLRKALEIIGLDPDDSYAGDYGFKILSVDNDYIPENAFETKDYSTNMDIDDLDDLFTNLDCMDDRDMKCLAGYLSDIDSLKDMNELDRVYHRIDDGDIIFYEDMTLEEVAEEMVEDGCYGNVDDNLKYYIDYGLMARDLRCDGYTETEYGVILDY